MNRKYLSSESKARTSSVPTSPYEMVIRIMDESGIVGLLLARYHFNDLSEPAKSYVLEHAISYVLE